MISSPPHVRKITQQQALRYLYKNSIRQVKKTVESVRSNTLEELYTEKFRPVQARANKTTVKSLNNGEPVETYVKGSLILGDSITATHRRKYEMFTLDKKKNLGSKSFGLGEYYDGFATQFYSGYIESNKNKEYAGTQIRLLQIACELAKKNGIENLPLISLFPATVFHTMMGFRPIGTTKTEVKSLKDVRRNLVDLMSLHNKTISKKYFKPIISKEDGKYFFDTNRTTYCAVMEENKDTLSRRNARNLGLSSFDDSGIDMELSGAELDKWFKRLEGFEILPSKETGLKPMGFWKWLLSML